MQPNGSPATRTRARKRKVLAIAGTSFLLAGAGSLSLTALADPVDSNIAASCSLGGSQVAVTVPLNVDDKVDPITAGGHETLVTKTGFPTLPVEVTIDKMVVTEPIPDQIASTESVTFSGGNMAGSYEINGQSLVLTFTGPVSSKDIQVPVVTAEQTVKDGIAPTTIDWKTFSQIVADTNFGQATCTPNDPTQSVNTTKVVAGDTTSTTSPTPTTTPTTPPTTVPTTPPTTVPTTPPTTTPGVPGVPDVPGLPTLPTPPGGLPSLPPLPTPPGGGLPTLPAPPTVPGLPTGPCPTLPVPLPVPLPLPAPPAVCPPLPSLPAPPALPTTPPSGGGSAGGSVHLTL